MRNPEWCIATLKSTWMVCTGTTAYEPSSSAAQMCKTPKQAHLSACKHFGSWKLSICQLSPNAMCHLINNLLAELHCLESSAICQLSPILLCQRSCNLSGGLSAQLQPVMQMMNLFAPNDNNCLNSICYMHSQHNYTKLLNQMKRLSSADI